MRGERIHIYLCFFIKNVDPTYEQNNVFCLLDVFSMIGGPYIGG
jgi:hypothetical protein